MGRYRSLDGLRGVAALAVVFWHVSLVVPAFTNVILRGEDPEQFTLEWWLTRTPFAAFEIGHEAVLVFFILSGFVLTLQFTSMPSTARSTRDYYARRLTRLYVPVWGAVGLAVLLAVIVPRDPSAESLWIATHDAPSALEVIKGLTLIGGSTGLNTPLWSLTLEVWFSLLLPVALIALRWMRVERWWVIAIALCIVASASALSIAPLLPVPSLALVLQYPPVFVIGIVLALRFDEIAVYARGLPWPLILAGVVGVTASQSIVVANEGVEALLRGGTLLGLTLVVVAAIEYSPLTKALSTRPTLWLGIRSFSLYLVHEPIVVAAALMVGAALWWPWLGIAVLLLPVILLVTEAFYRLVEKPSHKLSKRAGQWAAGPRKAEPRSG